MIVGLAGRSSTGVSETVSAVPVLVATGLPVQLFTTGVVVRVGRPSKADAGHMTPWRHMLNHIRFDQSLTGWQPEASACEW